MSQRFGSLGCVLAIVLMACVTGMPRHAMAAVDCVAPKGRIKKEICASPDLRVAVDSFETDFADALKRAPEQAGALRATERTWSTQLEQGCMMPNQDAFSRCIMAQYRIRTQELLLLVPKAAPSVGEPVVTPGAYISDEVIFRLSRAGEFEMTDLSRSHQANGHYAANGGDLTLLDGTGDVGATNFPLRCRVSKTAAGFAVKLGQPQCRQLEGISFRNAT